MCFYFLIHLPTNQRLQRTRVDQRLASNKPFAALRFAFHSLNRRDSQDFFEEFFGIFTFYSLYFDSKINGSYLEHLIRCDVYVENN